MDLPDAINYRKGSRPAGWLAPAALLAGLWSGCAVEPPQAPSTEFTISIPVANDSTRVEDLVGERSSFLDIDEQTGGMKIRVALPRQRDDPDAEPKILGRAEVGSNLRVRPTAQTFATALGDLEIPGRRIPEIAVGISQIVGQDVPSGSTIPLLPARGFDIPVPLPLVGITSLSVTSGGLAIAMVNELPVDVEGVRLTLFDERANAVVDEIDLGTLAANGGAGRDSFTLAGRTISGDLRISISGSTAQGTNVTVEEGDELRIEGELEPLLVSEATALLPQQEIRDQQVLPFPDDRIQVTEARISGGEMTLVVTNEIPIIMEVELTLPDLKDAQGNPQTFLIDSLFQNEPRQVSFDLDGSEFRPAKPLELSIAYRATTLESDRQVTIRSDGQITIEAVSEELVFERVQGLLKEVRLPLPDETREVDFPSGLDNVNIATTALAVYVTSGVGFQADVNLLFTGVSESGQTGTLNVRETFDRGSPLSPRPDTLTVSRQALTDFINLLPRTITLTPEVVIGDGREEEVIEPSHYVTLDSVVFETQPRLSIVEDTRIFPDERDISYRDSALRRKIDSNFRDASVVTELESSVPVGVGVRLMIARTREAVYDTASPDFVRAIPRLGRARFEVPAAPVDANGLSSGTTKNTVSVQLDREDVLDLILDDAVPGRRVDSLFSGVRVTLPKTNGDVEVRGTDYVNIISGLRLRLELNDKLVE